MPVSPNRSNQTFDPRSPTILWTRDTWANSGRLPFFKIVGVPPESWTSNGHPLALDPEAISTDPELPAFLRPTKGAPAYYGFPLLSGIECDGFELGMITDFIRESDAVEGSLYIVAPDGSRAGVVWCTGPRLSTPRE